MDLLIAARECASILSEPGIPGDIRDAFPQLFDVLRKIVITKPELMARGTREGGGPFQASDLFLDYLSALRARDWPQVRIIEHRIRAPSPSPSFSGLGS
jgi:hypothetical protein